LKIVQTYWSKPSKGNNEGHAENRHSGGWLSAPYHWMSWALSCHSFRRFYDEVELYTDAEGKALLIDTLQLPYTKVHVVMDRLNHLPALLWAAPKILTYALQRAPFIHADADVYIWKELDHNTTTSPLLAQGMEDNEAYYNGLLDQLEQQGLWMPPEMKGIPRTAQGLTTINVGVFGGSDLHFIHAYCKNLLRFYVFNREALATNAAGKLNPLDQFYFYQRAKAAGKPIHLLLGEDSSDFSELMLFNLVPHQKSYIHLLGAAKKNPLYCQMVALHLQYEFPDYYNRMKHVWETNDTEPVPVSEQPIPFESAFSYSLALLSIAGGSLHAQHPHSPSALEAMLLQSTALAQRPNLQQAANSIFLFERCRYELATQAVFLPDDTGRRPAFAKAKALLAAGQQAVLQQPLQLSPAARILALEHDVPNILAQPDWAAALYNEPPMPTGQHLYLYVRHRNANTSLYPLGDSNQLLYYFADGPFTGQSLIDLLMEEEPDDAQKEYYTDMVYYCLTNNLILTGYLVFAE
jgi:hypothetical protein